MNNRINDDGRINKWTFEPELMSLELNGYHSLIVRHPHMLFLLGYVGVNKEHPLYKKYDNDKDVYDLSCHGGITYIGDSPMNGIEGYWYFGFDTAHYDDYIPNLFPTILDSSKESDELESTLNKIVEVFDNIVEKLGGEKSDGFFFSKKTFNDESQYKDIIFVSEEVNSLLSQLMSIKDGAINISEINVKNRIKEDDEIIDE